MKTKEHAQGGIRSPLISLFLVLALCSTGIGIAVAEPVLSITPSTTNVDVGDDFNVFIEVDPAGYTLQLAHTDLIFDPSKVSIIEVVNGGMFETFFAPGTLGDGIIDDVTGVDMGVSSTGNLAEIRMHADNPGTFTIGLSDAEVATANEMLTPDINNGTVTVGAVPPTLTWQVEPPTSVTQGDDVTFDVSFSESADYYFRIEDGTGGVVWRYPTSGTGHAANPSARTWTTTTDTPTGDYILTININGVDNSDTRTVTVSAAVLTTVSIGSAEGSVGDSVNVSINITDASKICAMDIRVTYDPSILNATNVANGSMMTTLPDLLWASDVSSEGRVNISLATYPGMINGTGELFVVTFDIVGGDTGDSSILAINAEAWTGEVPPQSVTVAVENGYVTVTEPPVLTTITVSPATADLTVGGTQLFTATAYDQFGDVMPDVVITWMSMNAAAGTVDPLSATTDADGTATTTFTAVAEGTTTVAAINGSVYGTAAVTVTPPSLPVVTITTDASTYSPGGTMIVTLDIANPTSDPVTFEWYIGVPELDIWVTYARASIPAGFDNSYTIPIPVGNWGPTPFDLVHYVRMLDPAGGDVLVYDVAWCAYSPGRGEAMPVDIAEEIIKTVERVEC